MCGLARHLLINQPSDVLSERRATMRTLSVRHLLQHKISKGSKVEKNFLQRIFSFLIRDLVPSAIILIIISFCTLLVAEKIEQAKQSRTDAVVKANSFNWFFSGLPQKTSDTGWENLRATGMIDTPPPGRIHNLTLLSPSDNLQGMSNDQKPTPLFRISSLAELDAYFPPAPFNHSIVKNFGRWSELVVGVKSGRGTSGNV